MSVLIIAEAGINHNGNLDEAFKLVDEAKNACADAVKFQCFTPERLDPPGKRLDILKRCQLSKDNFMEIAKYCKEVGIEFMATPFDVDWLKFLVNDAKMKRIKISSSSIADESLLEAAKDTEMPVYLSTGMATYDDIGHALNILQSEDTILMHCVSEYPTPLSRVNLVRMMTLDRFCDYGFSDHSISIYPPIAAAALGASVIEKHIMYYGVSCPDEAVSIDKWDFTEMVIGIRDVEEAMKMGNKENKIHKVRKERDDWRKKCTF